MGYKALANTRQDLLDRVSEIELLRTQIRRWFAAWKDRGAPPLDRSKTGLFGADYGAHRQAGLDSLPNTLKTAEQQPRPEALPLLSRSAHFWGHVGNQAGRRLTAAVSARSATPAAEVERWLEESREAYVRAALFRIAGYKTSFFSDAAQDSLAPQTFDEAVATVS